MVLRRLLSAWFVGVLTAHLSPCFTLYTYSCIITQYPRNTFRFNGSSIPTQHTRSVISTHHSPPSTDISVQRTVSPNLTHFGSMDRLSRFNTSRFNGSPLPTQHISVHGSHIPIQHTSSCIITQIPRHFFQVKKRGRRLFFGKIRGQ